MYHCAHSCYLFFFFNDTATTEIYTLSLHDALPIYKHSAREFADMIVDQFDELLRQSARRSLVCPISLHPFVRSEEHTSELQSQSNLVCRLLLEKKKKQSYSL